MNTTSRFRFLRNTHFLTALAVFVLVMLFARGMIQARFDDLRSTMTSQIAEQQRLLSTIAEITARNGADTITETIVRDCTVTERSDFDTLLGRLDTGLTFAELNKLERLFGRCGTFYAARKSVMVARMEREVEIYESYVSQLASISSKKDIEGYQIEQWKALVNEEKKQSELFSKLVTLQDKIIRTLLTGKQSSSPEIRTILNEVKEVQETHAVSSTQASDIRATLNAL
jgi:hypothetical protein